jgi:hypothetical protein
MARVVRGDKVLVVLNGLAVESQGVLSQGTARARDSGETACRIAWCCGREVVEGRKPCPQYEEKMVGTFGLANGPGVTTGLLPSNNSA